MDCAEFACESWGFVSKNISDRHRVESRLQSSGLSIESNRSNDRSVCGVRERQKRHKSRALHSLSKHRLISSGHLQTLSRKKFSVLGHRTAKFIHLLVIDEETTLCIFLAANDWRRRCLKLRHVFFPRRNAPTANPSVLGLCGFAPRSSPRTPLRGLPEHLEAASRIGYPIPRRMPSPDQSQRPPQCREP